MPAWDSAGVPDNRPVLASNVAQVGWLPMLNVSVSLSASDAVGVKAYACPATTDVAGEPEITGARLPISTTTVNGPIDELARPSVALTVISL